MSTQERWDVFLKFINGPLAWQGEIRCTGPHIPIGTNPGPEGLRLDGYRGLDDRQATISCYDGATVSIVPIGTHQVRVSAEPNADWARIPAISKETQLSPGDAIHLGPPGRGATFSLVRCQRLGEWKQGAAVSIGVDTALEGQARKANDPLAGGKAGPAHRATRVGGGIPMWFLLAIPTMGAGFLGLIGILVLFFVVQREVPEPGPVDEGVATFSIKIGEDGEGGPDFFNDVLTDEKNTIKAYNFPGVEGAFATFVWDPNARVAAWPDLLKDKALWDPKLMRITGQTMSALSKGFAFWRMVDRARGDYAFVVGEMRKAGLPDALAAIPFHESSYTDARDAAYCAQGYWQFQPETAHRAGVPVQSCQISGKGVWTPTSLVPETPISRSIYVGSSGVGCLIKGCDVDGRKDIKLATAGAVKTLGEAFKDPLLASSGAAVQIAVASHNAGYDDNRYRSRPSPYQQLTAYTNYLKKGTKGTHYLDISGQKRAPSFIGINITCDGQPTLKDWNQSCGGSLPRGTQAYVPIILAQQFLAACYYGQNYADQFDAFKPYQALVVNEGYCKRFTIPTPEEVRSGKMSR